MKVQIIVGSTRQGRFSEKPAAWIYEQAKKRKDWEVELVDLRDYPLPFFEEPVSPSMMDGEYNNPDLQRWSRKVSEADGYIVVTPEYNHGYPAVLKNALDSEYHGWNKKPVGFVSYGNVGGARSVEQLRQVAVELQMAPVRQAIHIQWPLYMEVTNAKGGEQPLDKMENQANVLLDQLDWWGKALKYARMGEAK